LRSSYAGGTPGRLHDSDDGMPADVLKREEDVMGGLVDATEWARARPNWTRDDASVITTTTAIKLTTATTSSYIRRDLLSSSSVEPATRAQQMGTEPRARHELLVAHRRRSAAPTIRRPVVSDALTAFSRRTRRASQPRRLR
jgi:hypothetical protein